MKLMYDSSSYTDPEVIIKWRGKEQADKYKECAEANMQAGYVTEGLKMKREQSITS